MTANIPVPLICNPAAGRGRARRLSGAVARLLAENGVRADEILSLGKGDIETRVGELIRLGHRQILIAGGDGSIHEAVNGILRTDPQVGLGVIPIGTGNDFAKACSIPLHFEHATALLADRMTGDATPINIDVGRCNDRFFTNGAGIGFDARVSAIAETIRLPLGDLVYLVALVRALRQGIATPDLTIAFAEETLSGPVTLANFANGPWVGGLFNIAPEARNDDGFLDLVYAEPVGAARVLALLPKILRGRHMQEVEMHSFQVRSAVIEAAEPVISQLDGENQPPASHFEIEILPGALRLL